MTQVTFVCTGNVCRSAAAEAILKKMVHERHIPDVTVNSVGTLNLCEAERDGTMVRIAAGYGYQITGKSTFRSREVFMNADLILVMDKGAVIGCGTHDELVASCSIYNEIAESQMGGAILE